MKLSQNLIDKYVNKEISIYEIAKQLNTNPSKIYRYLKELGINTSTHQKERNKEIVRLYKEGYTMRKLAKICDITYQRVHQIIKKDRYL